MTANRWLLIGIAFAFSVALVSPQADTAKTAAPQKPAVTGRESAVRSTPADAQPTPSESPALAATAAVDSVSAASQPVNPILEAIQRRMDGEAPVEQATGARPRTSPMGDNFTAQIGKMLISLALVISIALGLAWAAKRYLISKTVFGGGYITYLSSYTLSQKSKLHLIKVGNETFLIGEGANQLSLISKLEMELDELDSPLPPEGTPDSPEKPSASFQNNLSRWQSTLENQSMQDEVKNSLLILGGLSKRLQKKG
ncbi:MAG: flagellar biosynthetic protein FliO, partial [bacterium]|nr:flagellar biosynthetic protein FliO [bacterium]